MSPNKAAGKIAFTGHRNARTTQTALAKILKNHPNAIWVHGGATGFDTQVQFFAIENGIKTIVLKPNYKVFGKVAPLIRNKEIVNRSDLLFACYDGRKGGGTDYTIKYALNQGQQVLFLSCLIEGSETIIKGNY